MKQQLVKEIQQYVEENIGTFHKKRIAGIERLKLSRILKRKNPYLFKSKNVLTANEIVKSIVDAHISSSEEGIFGDWLEGLAVFVNKKVSQDELDKLADLFNKPRMEVKKEGILNNLDLHFDNEPARHKLLDVIGDLSLLGKPIKGHVIAYRPGHKFNTEFTKLIYNKLNH